MDDTLHPRDAIADTRFFLGSLSPDQAAAIHRTALRDLSRLGFAEVRYLVIGNYDEGTYERVTFVRDELVDRRPDHEAFLLEEVDRSETAWENFYVKFRVLLARVDFVVGVFEDNDGGHELELGEARLSNTYVLKRRYSDETTERAHYDAMLATLFDVLDRRDHLFEWSDERELPEAVASLLEATSEDD